MDFTTTIVGALFGGLVSWWLTKYYYLKSNSDLKNHIDKLTRDLARTETLENFEHMLDSEEWVQDHQGDEPVWICSTNPLFQFDRRGESQEFYEEWMRVFPDRNGRVFDINLTIRGTIIKTLRFVSGDGGRYTLPLPEIYLLNEQREFAWRKNSLDFKIASIIGNFSRYDNLEEVANFVTIDLVTDQRHA